MAGEVRVKIIQDEKGRGTRKKFPAAGSVFVRSPDVQTGDKIVYESVDPGAAGFALTSPGSGQNPQYTDLAAGPGAFLLLDASNGPLTATLVTRTLKPDGTATFKLGEAGTVWIELHVEDAFIGRDLKHSGTKAGFFNATLVTQPTAYTQDFSTADKTHATRTAQTLTDNSGGTADTTVQALTDPADAPATADVLRDDLVANLIPELRNNIADLTAQINKLKVDLLDTAECLNAVIDDQQALGLAL